jgi:CheY-like chemotaxis protein
VLKPQVIFVDDDVFFAQGYVEALEESFTVHVCITASDAVALVKQNLDLCAAVLDVMMPSPREVDNITEQGLDTGLWVLSEIKKDVISRNIVVLLLTNRSVGYVEAATGQMGFPAGLIHVRSKVETARRSLPILLKSLINKRSQD